MIDNAKLAALCVRVMSDYIPDEPATEMTYLVAHTRSNWGSLFDKCRIEFPFPASHRVLISRNMDVTEEDNGTPDASLWREELGRIGFKEDDILSFNVHGDANTFTEMVAMVNFAKENGLKRLRFRAVPFQQPRAFITVVSVLLKQYPELRIYNSAGCPLPPNEPMRSSQNTLVGRRVNEFELEIEKIHRYHANDSLVDVEAVLDYLEWRDRA